MSKTMLVTFTPADPFFFGGELTFGNGEGRNFYAASRCFPQQTTLVGVLRHVLFEAGLKNNMGQSFVVGSQPDFGFLKSISPVFLKGNGQHLMPVIFPAKSEAAETCDTTKFSAVSVNYQESNTERTNFGGNSQPATSIKDFNEKEGLKEFLMDDSGSCLPYQKYFHEVSKTGIGRHRQTHITLDGYFYRQMMYKLQKSFSFACFVTGDDQLFEAIKKRNMPMGGEKVNFTLNVEETNQSFSDLFDQSFLRKRISGAFDWVMLTSDAFVESDIYDKCSLAMTDTISFRNIVTPDSSKYTGALKSSKDAIHRYKSKKFTMLKRGSILFAKDKLSDVTSHLDNPDFQKIGYNLYFKNQKQEQI